MLLSFFPSIFYLHHTLQHHFIAPRGCDNVILKFVCPVSNIKSQ